MSNEQPKRGRPKGYVVNKPESLIAQPTEQPKKKGNRSWRPSNLGDITGKEHGFRYRRVRKDDDNVAKKLEEGWEMVSKINSTETSLAHPTGRPNEGHQLDSTVGGRDWVLMRLDEDTGLSRDDFMNQKTARLERALKNQTQRDLSKEGTAAHGSISIEHRGVKTVIE